MRLLTPGSRARRYLRRVLGAGLAAAVRVARPAAAGRARILYYHRVDDELHRSCVTPAAFRAQMRHLREAGWTVVPLADLAGALAAGRSLPARTAAITFDDGFADNYTHAFPVLADLGLPATVFVTTGALGGTLRVLRDRPDGLPALTWAQLREMLRGPISVGSHTVTHPRLSRLAPAAVAAELERSRAAIAAETGVTTDLFCYPHGDVDARVRAAVAAAGYTVACATTPGAVTAGSDLLALPRTFVARDDTVEDFARKLAGAYDVLHHGVQLLRRRWGAAAA
jgi:peptidoglycan/xylan/chitin deacetylase (PgdA/CDA1 family)